MPSLFLQIKKSISYYAQNESQSDQVSVILENRNMKTDHSENFKLGLETEGFSSICI